MNSGCAQVPTAGQWPWGTGPDSASCCQCSGDFLEKNWATGALTSDYPLLLILYKLAGQRKFHSFHPPSSPRAKEVLLLVAGVQGLPGCHFLTESRPMFECPPVVTGLPASLGHALESRPRSLWSARSCSASSCPASSQCWSTHASPGLCGESRQVTSNSTPFRSHCDSLGPQPTIRVALSISHCPQVAELPQVPHRDKG